MDRRYELTASASHGLLPAGAPLTAGGRIERFPKADGTLYVARFPAPPHRTPTRILRLEGPLPLPP